MIICTSGLRVGKYAPLYERWNDVHQNCGLDVVGSIVVDDHSMADSSSTVMTTPDDFSLLPEDSL